MRRLLTGVEVLAFAGGVVFLLFFPRWLSDFRTSQVAYVGIYFIAILGLNILTGYTGQISLGHGAFMAIGGYTTAILVGHHGVKDLWTIPLAGLVAGVAGLVVGIPALRFSGLYLALVTFAIAVALPSVLKKFDHFTGGTQGINLFGVKGMTGTLGITVFGHKLTFNEWIYYLSWTVAVVLLAVAWALLRSRPGRTFRAIRDSEVAATSSGVNLPLNKTLAFGISAFYAGVAGSLFAIATTFVSPETFPIILSLYLVIGAAVAGLGSLAGLAVGAVFIQYLPDWSQQISKSPGAPSVIYGVVLIVVMLILPTGAGGLVKKISEPLTNWLSRGS